MADSHGAQIATFRWFSSVKGGNFAGGEALTFVNRDTAVLGLYHREKQFLFIEALDKDISINFSNELTVAGRVRFLAVMYNDYGQGDSGDYRKEKFPVPDQEAQGPHLRFHADHGKHRCRHHDEYHGAGRQERGQDAIDYKDPPTPRV